ncbi:MAG: hypothetical protein FJZ08_00225 [Candidatus Omnitrophica bacterium]|nr:hypothetical protein [Candidatus Omnitrophota bacterium]
MIFKNRMFLLAATLILAFLRSASSETLVSEKPAKVQGAVSEQRLERVEARIRELNQRLDLSLEQKIKVKEILTKEKTENAKIISEAAVKSRKLKEKADAEIESILTKKQLNLFRNVVSEEEEAQDEEDEMLKVFKSNKR